VKKHWPLNLLVGVFALVLGGSIYCADLAPQRKGVIEVVMCALIFSGAFMYVAFLLTALPCYFMARRKIRISYTTGWVAAVATTLLVMLSGCLVLHGSRVFTLAYWIGDWFVIRQWLLLWPWAFAVSTFVAQAVVVYFRRIPERDEAHMA
jgi:hypothetical protein